MGSLHSLLAPPLVSCRFSSFVNKSWCRDLLTVCFANLSARLYLRVARGWSPNLTHEIAGPSFLSENAATALCSVLWSLRDCWAVSPLPQTTDAASRWTLPSAFQKLHFSSSSSSVPAQMRSSTFERARQRSIDCWDPGMPHESYHLSLGYGRN